MSWSSEKTWLEMVLELEEDYYEDPVVYEFSDGKKFYCTDRSDSGIYDGS